jgi:hypothetical protein
VRSPRLNPPGAVDGPQLGGEFRCRGVTLLRLPAKAPQADAIQGGRERRPDGGGGRNGGLSDPQPLQEADLLEGQAARDDWKITE